MRRMILTSLVLLPVMAHAQAATSTEPQPSTSSANLHAELTAPAALAGVHAAPHAAVREFVQTKTTDNLLAAAVLQPGAIEYALKGSIPAEASAPRVTRAVEIDLSQQELDEQPAVSQVVLSAIVDENGVPRNVAITQSAGSVIDRKAIAAVNQYRFKPATLDNKATWATVSIAIKIQKP